MNCPFCNKLLILPPFSFITSHSLIPINECFNHSIKVVFYSNIIELQNENYIAFIENNKINIYKKYINVSPPETNSTLILSITENIHIAPESFDSTIKKLLSLKYLS